MPSVHSTPLYSLHLQYTLSCVYKCCVRCFAYHIWNTTCNDFGSFSFLSFFAFLSNTSHRHFNLQTHCTYIYYIWNNFFENKNLYFLRFYIFLNICHSPCRFSERQSSTITHKTVYVHYAVKCLQSLLPPPRTKNNTKNPITMAITSLHIIFRDRKCYITFIRFFILHLSLALFFQQQRACMCFAARTPSIHSLNGNGNNNNLIRLSFLVSSLIHIHLILFRRIYRFFLLRSFISYVWLCTEYIHVHILWIPAKLTALLYTLHIYSIIYSNRKGMAN